MADFINTIDLLGDDAVVDSIIDRSITEFKDNTITEIGDGAFAHCASLADISLPNLTDFLGDHNNYGAFRACKGITELTNQQIPSVTNLNFSAFRDCSITKVSLPNVTKLGWYALQGNQITSLDLPNLQNMDMNGAPGLHSSVTRLVFPSLTYMNSYAFSGNSYIECFEFGCTSDEVIFIGATSNFNLCNNLKALIIRSASVATLGGTNFNNTPIGKGTGYIYVPGSLVTSYTSATNWSTYAEQFRGIIEDEVALQGMINETLVDYKNDQITSIPKRGFYKYTPLKSIKATFVTNIDGNHTFAHCQSLISACFPNLKTLTAFNTFTQCPQLTIVDFGVVESIGSWVFNGTTKPETLIFRNKTVTTLGGIGGFSCSKRILVPRSLIEDYKVATNWVTYASLFEALEDYTLDGTTTGVVAVFFVTYELTRVDSNNTNSNTGKTYHTTLTSKSGQPISEIAITMGGVDVTDSVYNPETGEISIDMVTGDIVIQAIAKSNGNYLYELPQTTTFNGTSDFIDTGIKLFDTAKDFTIICVADFSKLDTNQRCLFHCMNESTPYPGLCVDGSSGVRICYTGSSSITQSITNRNDVKALAFRYKAGVLDAIRYVNAAGTVVNFSHDTAAKYTTVNQNLLLGAYQMTNGTKGRYYNGTINVFRVYEDHLTDDDLAEELITAYEES